MDQYSQQDAVTELAGVEGLLDGDARAAAASPVLPIALSARLGLDPAELTALRSDMFVSKPI
jgi:hypothetical protein